MCTPYGKVLERYNLARNAGSPDSSSLRRTLGAGERDSLKEELFLKYHRGIAENRTSPKSPSAIDVSGNTHGETSPPASQAPKLYRSRTTGRIIPRMPDPHPRVTYKPILERELRMNFLGRINEMGLDLHGRSTMIRNLEWELYATVVEANDKESVIDRLTQDNERLQEECDKNVDMTLEIQRLNEVNEMLSARLMEGYNKAMADKGLLMAGSNDLWTSGLEGSEASGRYGTQAQEPRASASSANSHTTRVAKKRKTSSPGSRVPRMQVSSKVRANYTDSDE